MTRRNHKLLKDMSAEELSTESEWHAQKALKLLAQVSQMRQLALIVDSKERGDLLRAAMETEAEADEHRHQSNVLDTVRSARLPRHGTGLVVPRPKPYTVRQNV
jgi:hypothetical protein